MRLQPISILHLSLVIVLALFTSLVSGGQSAVAEGNVKFLNVLDDSPIEFTYRLDQKITPAVESFHKTAKNPYNGDADAVMEGKKIFNKRCAACHLKDGTGRIGPNLVDDIWTRPRTDTDKGMFEVIYAGGAGAMQAMGRRIDQDEILKVMAYVQELRASAK